MTLIWQVFAGAVQVTLGLALFLLFVYALLWLYYLFKNLS